MPKRSSTSSVAVEAEAATAGGAPPPRAAPGAGAATLHAIVESLEDDIIFGRLRPNDRLVEDALMERHGAKRHVVRQAFAELETLGIVVREPNKGARIRAFSPKQVADIYDIRALLQGHAAYLVPIPAPPELLGALEDAYAAHSAAVEAGNLRAVYQTNNIFHDIIFDACGNEYLAEEIKRYATLAHSIRSYRIGDPVLLRQARDEHAAMIEALRTGHRARFAGLCVAHIEPSRQAYLRATSTDDPHARDRFPL